jgi:hypothetical protein
MSESGYQMQQCATRDLRPTQRSSCGRAQEHLGESMWLTHSLFGGLHFNQGA